MSPQGFEGIAGFRISPEVSAGFESDGIVSPTEVQLAAIEPILSGQPVLVHSATGTGKTLAYLLPILQRLLEQPQARAVVFTPATELAMQVLHTAEKYKDPSIGSGALVATGSHKRQKVRITKSTRLIVGTPVRILEQYQARKMKRVSMVVLDEPDPILASKGSSYLLEVLSRPDPKIQLVLAGATIGPTAQALCEKMIGQDLVHTETEDEPLKTRIRHWLEIVPSGSAADTCLTRILRNRKCRRALVFVNQPKLIRHLYRYLEVRGLNPVSLSLDRSKQQRQQAIASFRKAERGILLATDKSALGLDLPELKWVVHYELPPSPEAYVHRAGRTGRAGREGNSVIMVSPAKSYVVERMAKKLGIEFQ